MYSAIRHWTIQYILDYEPTQEQLEDLNCDSYELYVEPSETEQAKKERIQSALISTSDLSSVDLEWLNFSDIEIGDIIQTRVFGGNPHAESALQAKTSAYLLSALSWDPNTQLLEEITTKREQINEIRNKFNLNTI
jgi:hypothetical protein